MPSFISKTYALILPSTVLVWVRKCRGRLGCAWLAKNETKHIALVCEDAPAADATMDRWCGMHISELLPRAIVCDPEGDLTRSRNKAMVNPFPEGSLVCLLHQLLQSHHHRAFCLSETARLLPKPRKTTRIIFHPVTTQRGVACSMPLGPISQYDILIKVQCSHRLGGPWGCGF